jgi:hypothetical protein
MRVLRILGVACSIGNVFEALRQRLLDEDPWVVGAADVLTCVPFEEHDRPTRIECLALRSRQAAEAGVVGAERRENETENA